jgi:hypothetical protein
MFKTYRGQKYELAGTRPYVRRDGTETHLAVWRSHCAASCSTSWACRTTYQRPTAPMGGMAV